ncbi:smad nuclear-interacting protein 1-like [Hydractinia symbiolongicarpus]|uniref:smad nuclear-interacting protein 1-like n=1 Tax=Hydractinia symbiolongicarpus TaxID=13093 RepID=UPI00254B9951|nr:smad nuclear-interacting protein 1-like [Hydractinia symbiolongicarpus]
MRHFSKQAAKASKMADSSSESSDSDRKIRSKKRKDKRKPIISNKKTTKRRSSGEGSSEEEIKKRKYKKKDAKKEDRPKIRRVSSSDDDDDNSTLARETALRKRLKENYKGKQKQDSYEYFEDERKFKHSDTSDIDYKNKKDKTSPDYNKHRHKGHQNDSIFDNKTHRSKTGFRNIDGNFKNERDDRKENNERYENDKHSNKEFSETDRSRSLSRGGERRHVREWDRGKQGSHSADVRQSESFKKSETSNNSKNGTAVAKEEPNFKLSGKLTEYTNTYNGVVIMYNEPVEARKPKTKWRLYPFKGEQALTMLQLHRQSAFLLGRDRKVADVPVDHPSCSKQHSVLQFRLVDYERPDGTMGRRVKPYIIDLDSRNGTFVNNKKIEPRRYVELLEKDVLKFGFSSREYVLLHEKSQDDEEASGTDEESKDSKDD